MSYWRCHYHLIWTTRQRLPVLDLDREAIVARCVGSIAEVDGLKVHAIGVVSDHVHVAVSIPPRLTVASVAQKFKGSSSHQLQHATATDAAPWPAWQPEYGVLTFGEGSFERIVGYIRNQKARHRDNSLWSELEQSRADQHGLPIASP